METIKEKIAKLEKAIASPATPENIKMSMENALDDLKDKLAEEMSPTFTYYKGEQIMYEPTKNEYFVVGNDENIFNSLEDAKKFIDNPNGAINTEYAKMAAAETNEVVKNEAKREGLQKVVLDEGNGIIINDLFNEWNNIKNEKQSAQWKDKIKNTKFGTYGTVGLMETIKRFNPKLNDTVKRMFYTEIEAALGIDKKQRTYKPYVFERPSLKETPQVGNVGNMAAAETKELQKGIKVEQEHKDTLEGVATGEITVPQAIEETAKTHIEENPKYYDELEKIEGGDISNVQQEMQVQFDLIKAEIDKQKLKNKSVISVAKMRIEKMLKENPSAYPFYVEKYLDLPKSVRDRINPFDIWYSGEKRPVMEWLKEQNKNVFDVVKVEEYSSPKTKVIQTKPDDKNFMDIHADFVGDDNLRPVMLGTHFEENAIVSTNAHIMLITPYRGDAEKLDGNFCHTKKCIEENKEGYGGNKPVSDGRFPAWKQVVPFSNTEYNMNTAAVYDFIRNANKYELMNKITNTLVFKYGEEKIGFNANLMLTCIQGMSELGHKELSITIGTSNRAALIIPKGRAEDVRNIKTDFTLLMPVMLGGNDKWGNNDSPSEEIGMTYFGEFNLETSCYTDPNELTYCFDVEKVKVKKAEKKVKELEKKIEELTSAIEPMIKEKELPSAEKHGMFKVVNGIFEGTEFFGRIDGDRVINEDSIGQSFPIANVKRIGYELGQGYSSDFDFEGLLRTALRANTSWGIEALKKLHYSFEDNNYHTLGRPLWEAVKSLQLGAEPSAKLHLHEFHEAVQQELEDYLAPEVDESNIDPNTLQPIAKEEGSVEPIDAVEAITDAIEDNEKTSWEELKELAKAMIQVSKGKEKKEWVETKELAEVMLAD